MRERPAKCNQHAQSENLKSYLTVGGPGIYDAGIMVHEAMRKSNRKAALPMDLRDNISQKRRALGLTQEDVASKLGVSRQTVGKWESGRATPELEKLIALCDLLECSLDELVGRAEAKPEPETEIAEFQGDATAGVPEDASTETPSDDRPDGTLSSPCGSATTYATILAAGIWLLAAAIGLLSLLLGPSSVDNAEVRKVVPYATAMGIGFGTTLAIAAQMYRSRHMHSGTTDAASARRWRAGAIVALTAIVSGICLLCAFAPSMRTTTFICLEILALAAWPVTFAAVFTIDSRK